MIMISRGWFDADLDLAKNSWKTPTHPRDLFCSNKLKIFQKSFHIGWGMSIPPLCGYTHLFANQIFGMCFCIGHTYYARGGPVVAGSAGWSGGEQRGSGRAWRERDGRRQGEPVLLLPATDWVDLNLVRLCSRYFCSSEVQGHVHHF